MSELNDTAPGVAFDFGVAPGRMHLDSGRLSPAFSRAAFRRYEPAPREPLKSVSKIIEVEIIPRLVMARGSLAPSDNLPTMPADDSDPAGFAQLMLGATGSRAADCIQAFRDRGASLEAIYLDLLVPTARHLRHLWMNDEWDFADVTLAFWRMQQLLRDLSPAFCADASIRSTGLRALLAPGPGENNDVGHMIFGLVLAGEFLRRDGWDTWIEPNSAQTAFIDTIRTQWFDVVEFFSNSDKKLDDLASNIRTVRRESPNRDIGVMVGGTAFTERPELVLLVGGDAVVSDFSQESLQARNVVTLLTDQR